MSITFEVIIILGLILLNGLLAMAEIAVVSARKARLQQSADEGDARARMALRLAQDPADFLSTVQIGITLVGVLTGAFGGATIAEQLAVWFGQIPWLADYSEALGVTVVVLLITYFSLVLGELAPKRLGLGNPEKIAASVAGPLRLVSRLASPLVRLLTFSAGLVLRLVGYKDTGEPPVTEEEIKVLIDQGTRAGVFEEAEQEMVEAIFRLADRRVDAIMTPRTEIIWLDLDDDLNDNLALILESSHDRFPVARGSLDQVAGIVNAKDLLDCSLAERPLDLTASMQEPLFVPESMPALRVLEIFRETRQHLALVIDEYGGLQGMVTVFDLLESIVGEIPTRGSDDEPGIIQREDGSWLVDGRLQVEDFKETLDIASLPGDDRGYYQTMGGFMMTCLGRIPQASEHFETSGWRFEVVDMDGLRVDKLLVRRT